MATGHMENIQELKKSFIEEVKRLCEKERKVAVALSSGKDSTILIFALLELGKKVTAYSFHIDGIQSQDFVYAKNNSEKLGINFVECVIPKQADIDIVTDFIERFDRKKKVEVECLIPYYYLLPHVKEKILLVGLGAGHLIPLSKKVSIHYKHDIEKLKAYRKADLAVSIADVKTMNDIAKYMRANVTVKDPFCGQEVFDWFYEKKLEELNRPNQKQVFIDMFPEYFEKIKTLPHINLQCGDSGIRESFEHLLKDKQLNYRKRTRMLDLYRDIHEQTKQNSIFK